MQLIQLCQLAHQKVNLMKKLMILTKKKKLKLLKFKK